MKIMFLRESEGVYQFGHRRVHIKIVKGNQLFVRVGGGYVPVKNFIEEFTEPESAKSQRRLASLERFRNKTTL